MSRPTRLWWLGGTVWLLVVVLAWTFWAELRWAADALPTYLDASIRSPVERRLYRRARRIIRDEERDLSPAKPMLERSIAIDPYGEGYYWLGRYHERLGEDDQALVAYARFLAFDRTVATTYLRMAAIHTRNRRPDEARDLLREGLDYFRSDAERLRPREDTAVGRRFNEKAFETYSRYRSAIGTLQQALQDLTPDLDGTEDD